MSSTTTLATTQQAEIEETIKRIHTHKGVQGFILTSNDGNWILIYLNNMFIDHLKALLFVQQSIIQQQCHLQLLFEHFRTKQKVVLEI
jgi:hypothetical protein